MSRSLGTLTLDLIAKVGGFVEGMTKAERESKKRSDQISKNIRQIRSGLDTAAKSAAGFAAAYVASMVMTVNKGREAADVQAKLAQRMNTTSESVATLDRAAQLTGITMDQISTSSRQLDVNLASAAQGATVQADAFNKLGVSIQHLQSLPLDQRIAAINEALRANVDASERAAVAADIFGSRNAQALSLIDSSVIETARKEAELFGNAMSEFDLAKIEIANDAFSRIRSAFDGFAKQMAMQFAPVLQAIGDLFLDVAEDAGGMGNIAEKTFNNLVEGAIFAANAADGLKRVFSIAADVIIATVSKAAQYLSTAYGFILEQISRLPGVDFSETVASLNAFAETSKAVVGEAMGNVSETIAAPFAGDLLRAKISEYQKISDEAAAAEIERRKRHQLDIEEIEGVGGGGKGLDALRNRFMSESQLLGQKFVEEQKLLEESLEQKHITQQEFNDLRLQSEQAYEDSIQALSDRAAAARLSNMKSALGTISTLMNGESRKLFEIGKVAAIANASIDMYSGIMKAWALGPILGPVMAPLVAAAGAANIASIASTKFGGGRAGAGTASVSAASAPAMTTQDQMPNRNVYFSGINADEFYRGDMIIEAIDTELRNGGRFAGFIG